MNFIDHISRRQIFNSIPDPTVTVEMGIASLIRDRDSADVELRRRKPAPPNVAHS